MKRNNWYILNWVQQNCVKIIHQEDVTVFVGCLEMSWKSNIFIKWLKSVKMNGRLPFSSMTPLWRGGMSSLCVSPGELWVGEREEPLLESAPWTATVRVALQAEERAPPAGHPHLALSMRICCLPAAGDDSRWAFIVCPLRNNSRRMPLAELNLAWRHHRSGQGETRWRNLNETKSPRAFPRKLIIFAWR